MLAAVDSPSLMVIQALECLQHYWFGIGQPYQGNLCLGEFLPVAYSRPLITHIAGNMYLVGKYNVNKF
jgi:hypothetical protein